MLLIFPLYFFLQLFTVNTNGTDRPALIDGVVIDSESNEPVPYATLKLQAASFGTISNEEGKFQLKLEHRFGKDTLLISCMGYRTLKVAIPELAGKGPSSLKLDKVSIELNQVVVSTITAREIVEKAIRKIPENYLEEEVILHGFYRTASREHNKFVRLLEAAVKVQYQGLEREKKAVEYINVRKSKDNRCYKNEENNLLQDALMFDHVVYRRGFLSQFNRDFWEYETVGFTQLNEQDIYIIQARLLANSNMMGHEATLYIADATYAIVKVEYSYNWYKKHRTVMNDSLFSADVSWKGMFQYHEVPASNRYYLAYFNFQNKKEITDWRKVVQAEPEVYNEFIVQQITAGTSNLKAPNKEEDLYRQELYDKDFWSYFNVPVETPFYVNILADLDSLTSLPLQPELVK